MNPLQNHKNRKRPTRIKPFVGLILLMIGLPSLLFAMSERDLGPLPPMDQAAINRWVIFFTNVERVKEGRLPLAYDVRLEKAATWIADYCATKLGTISHDVGEPGMQSMSDRLAYFKAPGQSAGENLAVRFRANTENVTFYRNTDAKGDYRDFGDHKLFWRNDRQLAWKLVDGWMHSPGHYANIMGDFSSLGTGASPGKYGDNDAVYGAQVFTSNRRIDFSKFQWNAEKKSFTYSGKLQPTCFAVAGDEQPAVIRVEQQGKSYRCAAAKDEKRTVFAGLYDPADKITYPVVIVNSP